MAERDAGMTHDAGTTRDASTHDAGTTSDAGTTCSLWLNRAYCWDFDDYQQGTGWSLSPGSTVTLETYPDPNGQTGSARIRVGPSGHGFVSSPQIPFGPTDLTKVVLATTSFVLEPGARPSDVMAVDFGGKHRLVLAYSGAASGTVTEERPDGGRNVTHRFALPANGGSVWLGLRASFVADAGVNLGINGTWQAEVAIDPSRAIVSAQFGVLASADSGAEVLLDFGEIEIH